MTNISAAELVTVPPPLSPLTSTRTQHCPPRVCILGYSYHWDTVIIPGDLLLNPCHTHTRTEHEGCITRALLTVSYILSEILGK